MADDERTSRVAIYNLLEDMSIYLSRNHYWLDGAMRTRIDAVALEIAKQLLREFRLDSEQDERERDERMQDMERRLSLQEDVVTAAVTAPPEPAPAISRKSARQKRSRKPAKRRVRAK